MVRLRKAEKTMYTQETHETLNTPDDVTSAVRPSLADSVQYRVRVYFQDTGDKVFGADGSDHVDVAESQLGEVLAMVRGAGYIGTAERIDA